MVPDVHGAGRREEESASGRTPGNGFIELLAPRSVRELIVVLEEPGGRKVRIELRDGGVFDFWSRSRGRRR
jgi:hypothetical protein